MQRCKSATVAGILFICGSVWCSAQVTISGGTQDRIAKFSNSSTLTDSAITEENGNVGIATSNPVQALTVQGLAYIYGTGGDPSLFLGKQDAEVSQFNWGIVNTGNQIQNRLAIGNSAVSGGLPGFSEKMSVLTDGHVGIGTINATLPLTVVGTPGYAIVSSNPSSRPGSLKLGANTGNSSIVEMGILDAPPYGGWIQASNGGTNGGYPLMLNPSGGNVGIGTNSPSAMLDVAGNMKLSGTGASLTFPDATTQSTAWNGTLCGGDYAESVNASGDPAKYEPGDVLVVSDEDSADVKKSSQPYSSLVAGIYSTKPGVLGRRQTVEKNQQEIPMAMVGIVPTKVSAENGPIRKGDLLVTSSTTGYAMKGTDSSRMLGAIVGKSLGSLSDGFGVIEVLVSLQ